MNKLIPNHLLLLVVVLLSSCASISNTEQYGAQSCASANVTFSTNFAMGRMDKCQKVAENEYQITLVPENTPINSSPWYAFKVQAQQATDIRIVMKVQGDEHRYPPKISSDGKKWQLQKYRLKGDRLIIDMQATAQPVIIAGQEIIDNQYYVDWADKLQANALSANNEIMYQQLGESTQGRPIYKIETRDGQAKQWLVVLGRQHPPEITGALALFPFVETLLANSKVANEFRQKYNLLIIPNINPDGVASGNWRHNANGKDLNRDWNDFSQIETKQINDYLEQLVAQGDKISFAVDFHSTRSDIFYTMPADYGVEQPYLVEHWLGDLDQQMPNFKVKQKPGNNPNLGVSKQYFSDKYGVHAITYEMGDNTDRYKIKRIAYNAANTLMTTLLSDVNHNKK